MDENSGRPKVRLRHSPVEIERKFLVANNAWRQSAVRSVTIRDGLIAVYKDRKVRVRVSGDIATVAARSGLAAGRLKLALALSRGRIRNPVGGDRRRDVLSADL
jgi:hypothetical protein